MTHLKMSKAIAVCAVVAMTLTACGQKPGVHIASDVAGSGSLSTDGSSGGLDASSGGETTAGLDGTGEAGDDGLVLGDGGDATTGDDGAAAGGDAGAAAGDQATGSGDATTSGTTGDGSGGSGGGSGGSGGGGGTQEPPGNDSTGVSDDRIVLAVHAPVTGAAPLPTTSFEKSADLYWEYVTKGKKEQVVGRSEVDVIFADDKYDPTSARQVCRNLKDKAFLLVGGGGTDQIQACGQYAAVAKVPYFSAGVTTNGLDGNPWYFASSMTYAQQSYLLAQYVRKNVGGKTAAIITDTPNFDDAAQAWEKGVADFGLDYYKTLKHPKGDTSWYSGYAQDLKAAGVETVYINSSPLDYIRFAQKAAEQGFTPQYVGVGITMGLNAVLQSGCDYVDGGIFFSPFPGLDKAPAEFKKAGADYGKPADDIALALWGIAEQQHELLRRYEGFFGQKLTREAFRLLTENQSSIKTPVFPEVGYTPEDHFGGKQVHVLQADCGSEQYRTLATSKSSF
jgi:ABC-type branched-subunit amino acid transport system substrate-binding protein